MEGFMTAIVIVPSWRVKVGNCGNTPSRRSEALASLPMVSHQGLLLNLVKSPG